MGPGGSWSATWPGTAYRPFTFDPSCGLSEPCATCLAAGPAPPGPYTVEVRVSESYAPQAGDPCVAPAGPSGLVDGALCDPWIVSASLDVPTQTEVVLVVE